MKARATISLFAPWVLWPLVSFNATKQRSDENTERTVETLSITVLFLAVQLVRFSEPKAVKR